MLWCGLACAVELSHDCPVVPVEPTAVRSLLLTRVPKDWRTVGSSSELGSTVIEPDVSISLPSH